GDTIYVGSRIDNVPIAIVDIADPSTPTVVGSLGLPDEGLDGMSSRELRALPEQDLLVVLNLACDPALHGCSGHPAEGENLKLYDISDRRAPKLTATYSITSGILRPRSPHEMYLWHDGARALVFLAAPPAAPSYEVIDISDKTAPVQLATFDPVKAGLASQGADDILHSVSASPDGRLVYASHQRSGLVVFDQ